MITREKLPVPSTLTRGPNWRGFTKAFTAPAHSFYLFALYLAQLRGQCQRKRPKQQCWNLPHPGQARTLTHAEEDCEDLAKEYVVFLRISSSWRGIHYPIALEAL